MWVGGIFLVIIVAVNTQTWITGDNSTVVGCSTHCSLDDEDLTCWNTTLNFYSKVLIGQLRHYIAVQRKLMLESISVDCGIRLAH
ncbi:hypothetical protein OESDEN_18843 [Oesophagostomum dentatum]|uniref:Uncharacterized protein n=1 Tax=Oesophagostomum dentatum TaxID=61180 RepID=A0A0B1SC56_OESDE|nr:hypothetical protein OESDEN_18843 [Oesophagostomum dentatum]